MYRGRRKGREGGRPEGGWGAGGRRAAPANEPGVGEKLKHTFGSFQFLSLAGSYANSLYNMNALTSAGRRRAAVGQLGSGAPRRRRGLAG